MGAGVLTGTIRVVAGTQRLRARIVLSTRRAGYDEELWSYEHRVFMDLSAHLEDVAQNMLRQKNRRNSDDYTYVRVWELQNFAPTNRVMTESEVISGDGSAVRRTGRRISSVPPAWVMNETPTVLPIGDHVHMSTSVDTGRFQEELDRLGHTSREVLRDRLESRIWPVPEDLNS